MSAMADAFVPVFQIPVRPEASTDRALLLSTLSALVADDPGCRFVADDQTGEVLLLGTDEPQLAQKIDHLRGVPGIDITTGAPQIVFRETITRRAEVNYVHKKQFGGAGEFAKVKLVLEPLSPESGYACVIETSGTILPDKYIHGARSGVERALSAGIVAGFPVIGVTATVVDGGFHEIDSTAAAFAIAACGAARDALQAGNAVVLEPVLKADILAPPDCVERIVADLAARRAHILDRADRDGGSLIVATVPATDLLGYATALRSMSGGRARYSVRFDRYAPVVPPDDPRFRPAAAMRA